MLETSDDLRGRIKLCLFGASPDTGNLGVSALFQSVVNGIFARRPDTELTVFDFGRGVRNDSIIMEGKSFVVIRIGANPSRRFYRQDSLINMRASMALGFTNPGVSALKSACAVLDISGGDSFSDIYGKDRFEAITQPKHMVLRARVPLILLPQTYGPFDQANAQKTAREIVRGASMAWARDHRNFETLQELLGEAFNPGLHREGVDVAFALPARRPDDLPALLAHWIATDRTTPLVGFNISGLIYNRGAEGSRAFGFKSDYRDIIHLVLRRFLNETDARIVLIPHVLARPGSTEADTVACREVAASIGEDDRVIALDHEYDAMEMKWVIAQMDFFCGTRMHSTIAGLSSCVPTAAIAYSKKTLGVFESCGQGTAVTDPRQSDAQKCVSELWDVWENREARQALLRSTVPDVLRYAEEQMDSILAHVCPRRVM